MFFPALDPWVRGQRHWALQLPSPCFPATRTPHPPRAQCIKRSRHSNIAGPRSDQTARCCVLGLTWKDRQDEKINKQTNQYLDTMGRTGCCCWDHRGKRQREDCLRLGDSLMSACPQTRCFSYLCGVSIHSISIWVTRWLGSDKLQDGPLKNM